MTGLAVGAVTLLAGLLVTFGGARLPWRVVGFGGMALAALVVLVAARPREGATWWVVMTVVPALVAVLWLASALARPVDAESSGATLDDDPR